ncbi:GGDEF domain-containing protein [Xanthomonadaceae bacterium JHOS43]|nr:GGDEF domain-containing protein [Xanthomonadaceae bacterium JHOS43]
MILPPFHGHPVKRFASQDALTGIVNRREFNQRLLEAWQHQAENDEALAVLLVDVDEFKAYNDAHGHLAGDAALAQVASIIATRVGDGGRLAALRRRGICRAAARLRPRHRHRAGQRTRHCHPFGRTPRSSGSMPSDGWHAVPSPDRTGQAFRCDASMLPGPRRKSTKTSDSGCAVHSVTVDIPC